MAPDWLYYRRKSIDMRYSVYDPPKQEVGIAVNNQRLLTVDDPYSQGRRKYAAHNDSLQMNKLVNSLHFLT